MFGLKSQIVITAPQYTYLRPPHLGFYSNYIRPVGCSGRLTAFEWRRLAGCLIWGPGLDVSEVIKYMIAWLDRASGGWVTSVERGTAESASPTVSPESPCGGIR